MRKKFLAIIIILFFALGTLAVTQVFGKVIEVGDFSDSTVHQALQSWRMDKNFITYYATDWDEVKGFSRISHIPFIDHKRQITDPVTGEEYDRKLVMYCAFPIPRYLPKNLKKYANYITPTTDANGNTIRGGENFLSYILGTSYYLEVKRVGPPDPDLNPQPVTDTVYAILDDRGPAFSRVLDCSPAVLRTLGVKSTGKVGRAANGSVIDNKITAKLVPKGVNGNGFFYDTLYRTQKIIIPKDKGEIN